MQTTPHPSGSFHARICTIMVLCGTLFPPHASSAQQEKSTALEGMGWKVKAGKWSVDGDIVVGEGILGALTPSRPLANKATVSFAFNVSEGRTLRVMVGGLYGIYLDRLDGRVTVVGQTSHRLAGWGNGMTKHPGALFKKDVNLKGWHKLSVTMDKKKGKILYHLDGKRLYAGSSNDRTLQDPVISFHGGKVMLKHLSIK